MMDKNTERRMRLSHCEAAGREPFRRDGNPVYVVYCPGYCVLLAGTCGEIDDAYRWGKVPTCEHDGPVLGDEEPMLIGDRTRLTKAIKSGDMLD